MWCAPEVRRCCTYAQQRACMGVVLGPGAAVTCVVLDRVVLAEGWWLLREWPLRAVLHCRWVRSSMVPAAFLLRVPRLCSVFCCEQLVHWGGGGRGGAGSTVLWRMRVATGGMFQDAGQTYCDALVWGGWRATAWAAVAPVVWHASRRGCCHCCCSLHARDVWVRFWGPPLLWLGAQQLYMWPMCIFMRAAAVHHHHAAPYIPYTPTHAPPELPVVLG